MSDVQEINALFKTFSLDLIVVEHSETQVGDHGPQMVTRYMIVPSEGSRPYRGGYVPTKWIYSLDWLWESAHRIICDAQT